MGWPYLNKYIQKDYLPLPLFLTPIFASVFGADLDVSIEASVGVSTWICQGMISQMVGRYKGHLILGTV